MEEEEGGIEGLLGEGEGEVREPRRGGEEERESVLGFGFRVFGRENTHSKD